MTETDVTVASNGVFRSVDTAMKRVSMWQALPSFREAVPGLTAMLILAFFCGLPGIPWPFTIERFFSYIDHVLPPINGKGLFLDLLHCNYVVTGLILGLVIRNFIGVPKSWEPGLTFTPVLMNAGIVLIASQYFLHDLAKLGGTTITLMVVFVFGTANLVILLFRLFKVDERQAALQAAGIAMCGVSAIVAIAPMVKARTDQIAYTIATSIGFGILCIIMMPFIGRLVGIPEYAFGIWSAVGVPNSAQVIPTGFNYGFEAGKVAGFANIGRIVLIPAGVLYVYFVAFTSEFRREKISLWQVLKDKFPLFVFGFMAVWIMNCFHLFPVPARAAMEQVMIWFFAICYVGIGLQTKLGDVRKAGFGSVTTATAAGMLKLIGCLIVILIGLKYGYFLK
jgi:uncharacterized integral membrane protein (TIGR00698 family)